MASDFSKLCVVCGAQAKGINFNAQTCISCKVFFRRNALCSLEDMIGCAFNDSCEISILTRRFCSKCRLKKCFRVGMKKENIRSKIEKQRVKERQIAKSVRDNRQQQQQQTLMPQTSYNRSNSVDSSHSAESARSLNSVAYKMVEPVPTGTTGSNCQTAEFIPHQQQQQSSPCQIATFHHHQEPYKVQQHPQPEQNQFQGASFQDISSSQSENSNNSFQHSSSSLSSSPVSSVAEEYPSSQIQSWMIQQQQQQPVPTSSGFEGGPDYYQQHQSDYATSYHHNHQLNQNQNSVGYGNSSSTSTSSFDPYLYDLLNLASISCSTATQIEEPSNNSWWSKMSTIPLLN